MQIAIDETLRLVDDATSSAHIKAITDVVDFVVIKPIPVGGIKRFQIIAEQVIKSGKKVVVSGSMDTSIGLYETLLAQSLLEESSQLVAGAGTGSILSTDVVTETLKAHNGVIEIKRLEVDKSKIKESPNQHELVQRLNMSFDFGRERNWF
jgi:O-succinylbenzoate synthase